MTTPAPPPRTPSLGAPTLGTPPAEVDVSEELVRALLREQHPDLSEYPLTAVDSGWDNEIYRLGDDLVVRIPRREIAARFIRAERDWLPRLASKLPLPVSAPLRKGAPGCGYPWPWLIARWYVGSTANLDPPNSSEAGAFAEFLAALHQLAPSDAPTNEHRGSPIATRQVTTRSCLDALSDTSVVTPEVESAWQLAVEAPAATDSRWLHGDLHALNVLVRDGRLAAVIDWGDLCAGDIATDLASVWMLFGDPAARRQIRLLYDDAHGVDPARWHRALGWTVFFGSMLMATGRVDHPTHAAAGERTLERLTADMSDRSFRTQLRVS